MSYLITQEDILSVQADAAVVCIENTMAVSEEPVSQQLAAAGGEAFRSALAERRFLPVGYACETAVCGLPFRHVFATGTPQWRKGESSELIVLRLCYRAVFALARQAGCRTVAMPVLSAAYYLFPREEAVRVALEEAGKTDLTVIFSVQASELYALTQKTFTKPRIVSYLGYYRDAAVFELEDGRYARVDVRPELRAVNIRPYVEPCYYLVDDPAYPPLSAEEIARLRGIYETISDIN